MKRVLELATQNVADGGWPFAALILRDQEVIAEAVNSVHASFDPSDHAEIAVIRKASSILQTPDLSGCVMYVLGVPCPMCATCIILSKIREVRYAVATLEKDAALSALPPTQGLYSIISQGFGSAQIAYEQINAYESESIALFQKWNKHTSRQS